MLVLSVVCGAAPDPQSAISGVPRTALDELLDVYVRDGYVYYRALKQDRARLDAYVAALPGASVGSASREDQIAFWVNAYNALVLRTVIDHYPIARRSTEYPPGSIRQIPGAFERTEHRVAGRTLTLDAIEQTVLSTFQDPRVFLALGRGAVGSGRLRSEALSGAALDRQLSEAAAECVTRAQCAEIDRLNGRLLISPIFAWREQEFVAAYASRADEVFASRSGIERAALAFIAPHLVAAERELLGRNTFEVRYAPFDWTLNDLTGR